MPAWIIELAFRFTGAIYRNWKKTPVVFRDTRPIKDRKQKEMTTDTVVPLVLFTFSFIMFQLALRAEK